MADTGWLDPGTITQGSTTAPDWSNLNNVAASDNAYATANLTGTSPNHVSEYMYCTNFGAAIPSAVITGVEVAIERKASVVTASRPYIWGITLQYNGADKGNTKSGTIWTIADTYETFGSSSDGWSASLTPAITNDATFGVAFQVQNATGDITILSVDHVRVKIYYDPIIDKTLTDSTSDGVDTVAKTVYTFDYSTAVNNRAFIYNRKTGYWTYQDNAPFTQAVYRASTREVYATRRDAGLISKLSGSTFDGTAIASSIKTGFMNLGELDEIKALNPQYAETIKNLSAFLSECKGEGNLTLTIYTEADATGKIHTITLPTTDNVTLNVIRTALFRTIRGKYVAFKITNSSGNNFWVGECKIRVQPSELR